MTTEQGMKDFFGWLLETAKLQTKQFQTFCKCVDKYPHLHEDVKLLTKKECTELTGTNRVVVAYFNRFMEEMEGRVEYRECNEDGTYQVLPFRDVFQELNPNKAGTPVYVYLLKEDCGRFTPVTEVLDDLDIETRTQETVDADYEKFLETAKAVADEMAFKLEVDKALKDRNFEHADRLVVAWKERQITNA
ncbi:hypothetical protein [Bacillus thuringiensis]|uniref:hypothetical protein n=1 Tax=Bacillus thuringiensis TaxID=1428 RepID=UPI000BFDA042|nr:hypothetical protein [Bacillus thuringiensis]PGT89831.1 hypothetical protein COD17_08770 [Bacillus thuringiensis]